MKAYQMTSKQVRSFRKNTKEEIDGIEYHLCIDGQPCKRERSLLWGSGV